VAWHATPPALVSTRSALNPVGRNNSLEELSSRRKQGMSVWNPALSGDSLRNLIATRLSG
jgi:hypothetical protein